MKMVLMGRDAIVFDSEVLSTVEPDLQHFINFR